MASSANVTRVAAKCHLGGEGMLEHHPWKTMEWLHCPHCVGDGGMGGGHPLSPEDRIQRRGCTHLGGRPPCSRMEGHLPSPGWEERRWLYCGFALPPQAERSPQVNRQALREIQWLRSQAKPRTESSVWDPHSDPGTGTVHLLG